MYEEFVEPVPRAEHEHASGAATEIDPDAEPATASTAGHDAPVAEPARAQPDGADEPVEEPTDSTTPRPGRHLRAVPDSADSGVASPGEYGDEPIDTTVDPFAEFDIDEDTFHRVDLRLLDDADPLGSPAERLIAAFPGAELMDDTNKSDRQEW